MKQRSLEYLSSFDNRRMCGFGQLFNMSPAGNKQSWHQRWVSTCCLSDSKIICFELNRIRKGRCCDAEFRSAPGTVNDSRPYCPLQTGYVASSTTYRALKLHQMLL